MPSYRIDGVVPVVHPTAFVHPTAVLIGDVHIGSGCYVGPNACLRGDFGRIVMEEGSNIQDTCVMHGFPGKESVIRRNGHVGHGAILHGCVVGEDVLIGMNAVVLDESEIGARSIVGAGAILKARFECEPESLVVGAPAKVLRALRPEEIRWKQEGTREYQRLTERSLATMERCEPLTEAEPDRPALSVSQYAPKSSSDAG